MATTEQLLAQTHAAFRFVVSIGGERLAAFTECTLPAIEWEMEEVKEGGLNSYVHQLPGRRKATKLTLKNGVGKSALFQWFLSSMDETFERKNVTISLLDVQMHDVVSWVMNSAYPTKWTGPQLKSDVNAIAIQTLELACAEVTIDHGKAGATP